MVETEAEPGRLAQTISAIETDSAASLQGETLR